MLFFLSLNFWLGIALGAALSPLWTKVGAYLWSMFAKKDPKAAAEVAVAAAVVGDVAAPVVAAAEAKVPPAQ